MEAGFRDPGRRRRRRFAVEIGTPIDHHASDQTTTVYTGVKNFSMLPDELSTDLTSLNENGDRLAMVIEYWLPGTGSITSPDIYRALVRNHAQLAYNAVGAWLEGTGAAPPKVAASADLQAQLKFQDEAAQMLCEGRHRLGALDFDRVEAEAVMSDGQVQELGMRQRNPAPRDSIRGFHDRRQPVMAQTLSGAGVSSIRRVVRTPERWPRIVALAGQLRPEAPAEPDSGGAERISRNCGSDPVHYADISLAVIKLMGPGEYVLVAAGATDPGHFALAVHDYTHSTAPNRRFADLVTQRLIKSVLGEAAVALHGQRARVDRDELHGERRRGAQSGARVWEKRIAAVALASRVGESFDAVSHRRYPKGVFVRVMRPPAEGLLIRGESGVDVGDQFKVKLVGTNPRRGYIDFARSTACMFGPRTINLSNSPGRRSLCLSTHSLFCCLPHVCSRSRRCLPRRPNPCRSRPPSRRTSRRQRHESRSEWRDRPHEETGAGHGRYRFQLRRTRFSGI